MLVSQPLPDIQSGFDSLQRSVSSGTSTSSNKSPSKVSSAPSSYASSTSNNSSPANENVSSQLLQTYGLSGCDEQSVDFNAAQSFLQTDEHVFQVSNKDSSEAMMRSPNSPQSSLQSHSNLYSVASESGMSVDFQPSRDTLPIQVQSQSEAETAHENPLLRATPPSVDLDSNAFGNGGDESQYSEQTPLSKTLLPASAIPRKSYEHVTDKELRKKLKNRESAQAARDRKKAKMLNLERQIADLLERNVMVENENRKLRARIQQLESEAYWRMTNIEFHSHNQDGNATAYSSQLMTSQHSTNTLAHGHLVPSSTERELYGPHCSFGGGAPHHSVTAMSGLDNALHGEKEDFQAYPMDTSVGTLTEYAQGNYLQHVWPNERVQPVQGTAEGYPVNSAYASSPAEITPAGGSLIV